VLFAIIVAIITFIVATAAVAAFFVLRARRAGTVAKPSHTGRDRVRSVANVGVKSTLDEQVRARGGKHATPTTAPAETTTGRVSESLRSRFVALGVLAAAIFGSLTVKLWSMQVLASGEYKNEALQNKYTTVATPAPRGLIYDSDGVMLVGNRTALTVLADAEVADDHDVVQRLSTVLGIPYNVVRMRIQDQSSGAQSQRVVASDVRQRDIAFIAEHSDAFTGVTIQERAVRDYPYGALAAHVLGYTGAISDAELETMPANRNVELGDIVGKSGVESYYDNLLAGEHGQRRVVADSKGRVVEVESETPALRGSDVYLTIKAAAQYVADVELAELIAPGNVIGKGKGVGGAVVAMDVTDGSILVMSSYPTFTPETFNGGITQDVWDLYSTAESYYPLLNRTISGLYPAASTYKAFSSLAALKYDFANKDTKWVCEGTWDGFGSGDWQDCWLRSGHGELDLHGGIVNSCDVVFYEIGKAFYFAGKTQGGTISDTALQEEIAKFGFGKTTGIDLTGEEGGRVPTPEWKEAYWSDVPTEGFWRGGDMTNLIIGQGDVLTTPLQIAVAYGAVATGNIMKPHLFKEVRNGEGANAAAIEFESEVVDVPEVDEKYYKEVRDALAEVALGSSDIMSAFADWGVDPTMVGSKTGTGEMAGKEDTAWYVCYYPKDKPKYVVSTCIEQGGGGSAVAGPVGAHVLGALLAVENGELTDIGRVAGSSGKSVEVSSSGGGRTD